MFQQVSDIWRAFLLLSLCLQLASWTLVIYWSRHHWHSHSISRALQAHIHPPHSSWGSVATSINSEFRRIDKFATGPPGARVIVTDSWVLKVSKKPFICVYIVWCKLEVSKLRPVGHVLAENLNYMFCDFF